MPLIRAHVRNEYGLGIKDLYLDPARRGDPKGVLDGVAVSGLVGILRQLGDLAGFAADIFHDLHEQVAATSARSHRMMARVQQLETSFPTVEKNIHALDSHIHLAYLPGADWHSDIQIEHDHLLASELPRFLMDSYEECRDPPRLFLLDKFDSGGAGSCLRRYSDPTYFRRTWADLHRMEVDKFVKERKRKKLKGLQMRNVEMLHVTSLPHGSDRRIRFSSPSSDEECTAIDAISSSIMRQRHEVESDTSSDSRTSLVDVNPVPSATSTELDESFYKKLSGSNIKIQQHYEHFLKSDEGPEGVDDSLASSREDKGPRSPSVTWDEKTELPRASTPKQLDTDLREKSQNNWNSEPEGIHLETDDSKLRISDQEDKSDNIAILPHQEKFQFGTGNTVTCPCSNGFTDEVNSEAENYVDALNSLDSEAETDSEFQTKWELKPVLMSSSPAEFTASGEPEKPASASSSTSDGSHSISKSCLNNQASSECDNSFISKDMNSSSSFHITDHGNAAHMIPERKNGEPVSTTPKSHAGLGDDPITDTSITQNTSETREHNEVNDLWSRSKLTESRDDVGGAYLRQDTEEFSIPSVEIWTNGGLLGLKPSKPADLRTEGTVSQSQSDANINESDLPGLMSGLDQKDGVIKYDAAIGSKESKWGKCSMKDIDDLNSSTSQWHEQTPNGKADQQKQSFVDDCKNGSENFQVSISQQPAKCKLESSAESQSPNVLHEHHQLSMMKNKGPSICDKHSEVSTIKDAEDSSHEMNANQESNTVSSEEFSSTLFRLYPLSPPSPPLEHMKISFHPLNRNVTSKLKLEFTDNPVDDSVQELTFPSFQLLPGAHVSMHHISSESDDDTFCRSSHYSDNAFSHHSETDSEIWDQDQQSTSGNNDNHYIKISASSAVSVASSVEYDMAKHSQLNMEMDSEITNHEKDHMTSFQSNHLLNIPGLESLNPSITRQGKSCNTGSNDVSDPTFINQNELPPLPPLPPLEWRQTKPTHVSGEFRNRLSEVINQMKGKGNPNLIEPASVNGISNGKELVQHMNGAQVGCRNGEMKIVSPKTPYEREDFLQQIRNKSFNLRRTVVNRPSFMPEPVANIKVAAILAKASSIRHAFGGSDRGEDEDNWSDG